MRPISLKALAFTCAASALFAIPAFSETVSAPTPAPTPSTDADASGRVVKYTPAYFAEFQVSTAFDMVLRVPGFSFDGGDYARGFSGTAGNVLIDGQRPATKSDLGNTLSNINAAQVDHIELITGGAPGIDMHGHRQIVNVIRKSDAKPNLSLLGIVRNMGGRQTAGVLLFTYNDNRNGKSTDITGDVFSFFDNGATNARRLTKDSSGTQIMDIHQHAGGAGMESQASHSRPLWGGKISVNGTYNPMVYSQTATYIEGNSIATEHTDYKETPSEIGGQYERKFAHGLGIDLNVLRRHDRERTVDIYGDGTDVSDYRSLVLSDERILSGHLTWQKREGLSFNFGTETAFNSRDTISSFVVNATSQNVPTTSVRVEEDRTESFASANWKVTPKLSVEAEIKAETSTISVPQNNRSDSFVYYKPRFQAVYALSDKTKVSWKTIRHVDQLSFGSFASSVQLQTNQVTLGNTALVPQKDWMNTLILERSFWDKGALTLAYERYNVEDTSDFIAVVNGPNVYTASGNIGKAEIDIFKIKLDLPLDKLYVKHGMLNIDWSNRQSHVKDPVTGNMRRISGMEPHRYSVSFTQELPAVHSSWGVDVEGINNDRNYLANELSNSHFAPWTQIWYQYKTPKKVEFKVSLRNPLGLRFTTDRTVYQGLRSQTPIAYTQHTTSKIPQIIEFRIKKEM